jgi:hypothetical protein
MIPCSAVNSLPSRIISVARSALARCAARSAVGSTPAATTGTPVPLFKCAASRSTSSSMRMARSYRLPAPWIQTTVFSSSSFFSRPAFRSTSQ